ncbi:hypothetical protein ACGK9U_01740 [Mariniflexile sp. HNIBRBA6329]|uniref:hypothetical protein n=1 Tax=Mariniflexile sp. HNIBRBA6329 TaxID=3373088 RepID=UPI003744CF13
MNTKLIKLKDEFITKQKQLEYARNTLKKEFFGIDKAIDELVNNTRSWYVLNEYQTRPLVVNLWGLTGVGKTSLITRLAELLNCNDSLFKFDLGIKTSSSSFTRGLDDLCEKDESKPIIIALDEFQHSRTLRGPLREEVQEDDNRKVWELIDSGKIEYYPWDHGLYNLIDYTKKLQFLLQSSVKVEKGKIIKGISIYNAEFNGDSFWDDDDDNKKNLFVKRSIYSSILDYAGKAFHFNLIQDVNKHLLNLNGEETIAFLYNVIKIAKKPKTKNFTKALIFIIGNLDEAYTMSNNLTADIDADLFHESSLKITIPQIKNALSNRFRKEQISRLGNIHIIYPALNKEAYKAIILNELQKVITKTKNHIGLKIKFDESVSDLIYKEGVFPTQGVRPLLTSLNYLIKTNLSIFFSEIIIKNLNSSELSFHIFEKELVCSYLYRNKIVHNKKVSVLTPLEDIRISKKDDLQAITAVHESGHAIISAILLKVVPEHIYSVTTEGDNNGFIYTKFPWNYIAKKEIVKRIAMYLGGIMAEELVFGKDNITAGSSSDIIMATKFLSNMYKLNGLGTIPMFFDLDSANNDSYHDCNDVELLIKETLKEGYELAKCTLIKEMKLLLTLSNYLSDHSSIDKLALEKMIKKYKISEVELINNSELLYYRNELKSKISSDLSSISKELFNTISLNHKNNK